MKLVDVLPGSLAPQLREPEKLLRLDPPGTPPKPRVHCSDREWPLVVKALIERGLVRVVDKTPKLEAHFMSNGAFGVPRVNEFTDSGLPVLRIILDLRATNFVMKQLNGDGYKLTGTSSLQRFIHDDGKGLLVSGEDLTSSFFLFELPDCWPEYMTLEKPVMPEDIGLKGSSPLWVGLRVSAGSITQAALRELSLRAPSLGGAGLDKLAAVTSDDKYPELQADPPWIMFVDDAMLLDQIHKAVEASLEGQSEQVQEHLGRGYAWLGIPVDKEKVRFQYNEVGKMDNSSILFTQSGSHTLGTPLGPFSSTKISICFQI